MDNKRCAKKEGAPGLLAALIHTGKVAEARLDDALAKVGLTFVKWRTLETLVESAEPITLGQLAEQLGCVKSNVTQLIDKLEADGAARRISDRADRRSVLVDISESGREQYMRGLDALTEASSAMVASIPEAERSQLRERLNVLGGG